MILYILQNSESGKYYVGCTENIEQRVKEHNIKRKRKWSGRQKGEWKPVYIKLFESKRDALIEEQEIKRKKSREYIERLIETQNATGSSISLV